MISRFLKWGIIISLTVAVALSIYFYYLYRQIRYQAVQDETRAADTIVILGAAQYNGKPSPVLKARLDHALDLYKKGYAGAIITTGSYGPDPNFSEAHVSASYLVEHGVDATRIITEQGGDSTHDSIEASVTHMQARGWKTTLVVSDGFHLFRVKRMFEDRGIRPYASPAPESPIEAASSQRLWHSMREVILFTAYRLLDL